MLIRTLAAFVTAAVVGVGPCSGQPAPLGVMTQQPAKLYQHRYGTAPTCSELRAGALPATEWPTFSFFEFRQQVGDVVAVEHRLKNIKGVFCEEDVVFTADGAMFAEDRLAKMNPTEFAEELRIRLVARRLQVGDPEPFIPLACGDADVTATATDRGAVRRYTCVDQVVEVVAGRVVSVTKSAAIRISH